MDWYSPNPISQINDVLLDLHSAMHISGIMKKLISHLPALVPVASIAAFYVGDDGWQFTEIISPNLSSNLFKAYKEYYEPYDDYKKIVFARDPIPAIDRSSDYMDYKQWDKNPHRREFLVPNGMYHLAGMQIFVGAQLVADITLHREEDTPDFSQKEMYILQMLQQHVSLACRNSRMYDATENTKDALTAALNTSNRGVIIFDFSLRPIYKNTAANFIGERYRQDVGNVRLTDVLSDIIRQRREASSDLLVDTPSWDGYLHMPNKNLVYTIIKTTISPNQTQYIVYIELRNTKGCPELKREMPFGLSYREYEIAKLVTRGMSNAAIAVILSISQNTVKTHLKHIMRKTGSRTRAEVVYTLFGDQIGSGTLKSLTEQDDEDEERL